MADENKTSVPPAPVGPAPSNLAGDAPQPSVPAAPMPHFPGADAQQSVSAGPPPRFPGADDQQPQPGERLEYQPVSSWAVAGAFVGFGVTALVLFSILYSLATDEPSFLPGWLVGGLSTGGAALSFIAMRQISLSENTRTGTALAHWSLWLCILTGSGFFVFDLGSRLALQNQANAFVMEKSPDDDGLVPETGFVPRLLDGCSDPVQFNCAFLLTVPERAGTNPRDKASMQAFDTPPKDMKTPTKMAQFRDNAMVRFVRDIGVHDRSLIKIEPLSVQSCEYVPRGKGKGFYEVVRTYKVSTPEIVRVFTLSVDSIEPSGPGEKRKWFLALPQEQMKQGFRTPLGVALKALRFHAHAALAKWNNEPDRKMSELDRTPYEKLLPDEKQSEQLKAAFAGYEERNDKLIIIPIGNVEVTPWQAVDKRIRIDYPVQAIVPVLGAGILYKLEGYVKLESNGPVDPETYSEDSPNPGWTIRSLKWVRANEVAKIPRGK